MLLNVGALLLYVINIVMRGTAEANVGTGPFVLSIIGVVGIIASGWLGGHMVYVHGMAVDETEVCAPTRTLYRALGSNDVEAPFFRSPISVSHIALSASGEGNVRAFRTNNRSRDG